MTNPTILLVDDELAIGQQLKPFLERAGYSVALAHDGQAALDAVSTQRPDLIVMDVLMPRLDGRAALRHLRQAADWTPVILPGWPASRARPAWPATTGRPAPLAASRSASRSPRTPTC